MIFIDTETTGLSPIKDKILTIQYLDDKRDYTVFLKPSFIEVDENENVTNVVFNDKKLNSLRRLIGNSEETYCFHNAPFDIDFMETVGIQVKGNVFDTQLAIKILGSENDFRLKTLCENLFNFPTDDEKELKNYVQGKLLERDIDMFGRSLEQFYHLALNNKDYLEIYAMNDVLRTQRLYYYLQERLEQINDETKNAIDFEMDVFSRLAYRIRKNGIFIKRDDLLNFIKKKRNQFLAVKKDFPILLKDKYDFQLPLNWGKNYPLKKYIFSTLLKIKPSSLMTNNTIDYSPLQIKKILKEDDLDVNQRAVLEKYVEQEDKLQEYNSASEIIKSCLLSDNASDLIFYPNFNQYNRPYGASSISLPYVKNSLSLQDLTSFITPRPRHFWMELEYTDMEPRVFAAMSDNNYLINCFNNNPNYDIYEEITNKVFNLSPEEEEYASAYQLSKEIVKNVFNGGGAKTLSNKISYPLDKTIKIRDTFFTNFPEFLSFARGLARSSNRINYTLTAFRRRIYVANMHGSLAIKYAINGTIVDFLKRKISVFYNWQNRDKANRRGEIVFFAENKIIIEIPQKLDKKEFIDKIIEIFTSQDGELGAIKIKLRAKYIEENDNLSTGAYYV